MFYVVDRFEENIAVLENLDNNSRLNISKTFLPSEIKEGDVLEQVNEEWFFNKEKNEERKNKINDKFNSLWG